MFYLPFHLWQVSVGPDRWQVAASFVVLVSNERCQISMSIACSSYWLICSGLTSLFSLNSEKWKKENGLKALSRWNENTVKENKRVVKGKKEERSRLKKIKILEEETITRPLEKKGENNTHKK